MTESVSVNHSLKVGFFDWMSEKLTAIPFPFTSTKGVDPASLEGRVNVEAPAKESALPSPQMVETGKKAHRSFLDRVLVTGPVQEHLYFVNDLAGIPRAGADLAQAIHGQAFPVSVPPIGIATSFSVITGFISGSRGIKGYRVAKKVDDFWGKVSSKFMMARGVLETFGGLFFIPMRGLAIAASKSASKTIVAASNVLSKVGGSLFGVIYCLMLIPIGITLFQGVQLSRALKEEVNQESEPSGRLERARSFFRSRLALTDEDRNEVFERALICQDKKLMDVETLPAEEKWGIWLKIANDEKTREMSPQEHDALYKKYGHELLKAKMRKTEELKRACGDSGYELVKRLVDGETLHEDPHEALKKMQKAITLHNVFNALGMFGYLVAASAFIAGTLLTGGLGGTIAVAVLFFLTSVLELSMDGYDLFQAFKKEMPNKIEKLILAIASVDMLIGLGICLFLSTGPVGYIATALVAALWIALQIYTYKKWN